MRVSELAMGFSTIRVEQHHVARVHRGAADGYNAYVNALVTGPSIST
jgi:hypothetical protein